MLFGLFSKDRALRKDTERAANPLLQAVDRQAAMERLRKDGSPDALFALCKRFSFTSDKLIEDQDEKDWVVSTLTALGEDALPALTRYMKSAKTLGYALKVLAQVTTESKAFEVLDELLADEEPGYVRDPTRRIDIIAWLGECAAQPKSIVPRVLPYVEDYDENVRVKSIESISRKPDACAAETMCRAMVREGEESRRFQVRCAEILAEHAWSVKSHEDEIKELLPTILDKFQLQNATLTLR